LSFNHHFLIGVNGGASPVLVLIVLLNDLNIL